METFKVMSYNVDGLPLTIDLSNLPWYLKPVYWVLKWKKINTLIDANSGGTGSEGAKKIASLIKQNNYDIIGFNEDFNYHNDYTDALSSTYNFSTFKGAIDFSHFFKMLHLHWKRYPSWKSDGLCLLTNSSRVKVISEDIVTWNDSYGYVDHCNDALTDKGFRHYIVTVDDVLNLNVYILHMDADTWDDSNNTPDVEARTNQFKQLSEYIQNHNDNNPTIIMGDFNSMYYREYDKDNFETYFTSKFDDMHDAYVYCGKHGREEIDKVFFFNCSGSEYVIEPVSCVINDKDCYDSEGKMLSDHYPIIAEFSYRKR